MIREDVIDVDMVRVKRGKDLEISGVYHMLAGYPVLLHCCGCDRRPRWEVRTAAKTLTLSDGQSVVWMHLPRQSRAVNTNRARARDTPHHAPEIVTIASGSVGRSASTVRTDKPDRSSLVDTPRWARVSSPDLPTDPTIEVIALLGGSTVVGVPGDSVDAAGAGPTVSSGPMTAMRFFEVGLDRQSYRGNFLTAIYS